MGVYVMNRVILLGIIETLKKVETDIDNLAEVGTERTDNMQDDLTTIIKIIEEELKNVKKKKKRIFKQTRERNTSLANT